MNCLRLACPPLRVVRIGLIGLGNRGLATLRRLVVLPHVQVTALSDLRGDNLSEAVTILRSLGRLEPATFYGEGRWRQIAASDEVDIIYICTDWASHAEMAVYAMQRGKHAALEVPAAMSVSECWALVRMAEATRRHCVMLENCCYDTFHLGTLGLLREGLLGDLTHLEGAYIHDLRARYAAPEQCGGYHKGWMGTATERHGGNPYPTHGLGPVCQLLGIHRGDHLVALSSMTGQNNVNTTLLRTERGRTVVIGYDVCTPRPYSRRQTVCGTRGFVEKYPRPCCQTADTLRYDAEAESYVESHIEPALQRIIAEGRALGVPNVMNYAMDRRLTDALHLGLPLDMDVYDAAEWSCLTELTQQSARRGGEVVAVPRFI